MDSWLPPEPSPQIFRNGEMSTPGAAPRQQPRTLWFPETTALEHASQTQDSIERLPSQRQVT
jgi:hypothetical protein